MRWTRQVAVALGLLALTCLLFTLILGVLWYVPYVGLTTTVLLSAVIGASDLVATASPRQFWLTRIPLALPAGVAVSAWPRV